MAESSAALSLRESFGDRKLPDITRKITACVACRKQKIKCHMNGSNEPCRRCKARGLPCTVNKSLQMLLESDAGWKESMEKRMRKLEESLRDRPNQQDRFLSSTPEAQTSPTVISDIDRERTSSHASSNYEEAESASDVTLNLSCSLGSFPGSSIKTILATDQETQSDYKPDLISCGEVLGPDLISQGLISLEAAEEYFAVYRNFMEPCIYQILATDDCLAKIRARSSLLTAAIYTVGSFGTDSANHKRCYDIFLKEVSSRLFSRHHSFDDIRALCIGAFWLNKVSSTLIGLAVRMANNLNLHRCITKMPHTKIECYERTRLYFLVYICDHHCSLIYGKPPLTREFESLKSPRAFLESKFCTPTDAKLISHIELWEICSRVFDVFGADIEASITNERVTELESLSRCFDPCRADAIANNDNPDIFSQQLFDLYIHCSKLYLFSHTFRGSSHRYPRFSSPLQDMEIERSALENALAIVRSVAWGDEIQRRLERLPSYFIIMIAFASISLIKTWGKEPTMCYLDKTDVSSALNRLVEVFDACSASVQPEHPLCSLAKGLKVAMNGSCSQAEGNQTDVDFMPDMIDSSLFAFDNLGSSSFGFDYLDDHNNLMSSPRDFHSNLFGFQNL